MTVFELEAILKLNSESYSEGLTNAENQASGFGDTVKGVFGGQLLYGVITQAVSAIGRFGRSSIAAGMNFDQSMSQVAATMGVTTDEISELSDFAQEMGRTTSFSATQAADALNYMALAGYDVDESMTMLPTVLNLAAAGSIDLAYASDMVTDTQSALGLSMSDTATLVDQMAAASSNSNTSVAQLGEALLTLGATGRGVKGGTEELSTVLGILANNGIKGAEGGTHLRNILLSLQNPTDEAAQMMNELGIAVYDSDGNMRSLVDIVGDMQTATEDMDQASRDAIVSGIFNKTDLAAVNALLNTTQGDFENLHTAISNSAGAAERMADTQLDNLAGDVTLFKSALEGAQITMTEQVTPALREIVQYGTSAISNITSAYKEGGISGAISAIGEEVSTGVQMLVEGLVSVVGNLPTILGNAAQLALSIIGGVIEGTITGLNKGFAELGGAEDWLNSYDAIQRAEAIRDSVSEISKAIDAVNEKKIENIEGVETQAEIYQTYIDRFHELVDGQGTIKEGYEEEVTQLLEILGVDAEVRGNQVTNIGDVETQIATLVESYKKEAYTQAELASQTELITQRAEAYRQYNSAIAEVEENLAAAQAYYEANIGGDYDESVYNNYIQAATDAATAVFEAAGVIAEADAYISLSDQNMAAISQGAWDDMKYTLEEAGIEIPSILESSVGQSFNDFADNMAKALGVDDQGGAIYATFVDKLRNMLEEAGYTVDENSGYIVDTISDALQGVSEAPQAVAGTWQESLQTVFGDNFNRSLETMLNAAEGAGFEIPTTIATTMEENGISVNDAVVALGELMNAQWDIDSTSLSDRTKEMLETMLEHVDENAPEITGKLSQAITDGEPEVSDATREVVEAAEEELEKAPPKFGQVGTVMTSSVTSSMLDEKDNFALSAASLVSSGIASMVTSIALGKPNVEAEVANMESGMETEIDPVKDAMSDAGDASAENLDSSFGAWNSTVEQTVTRMYNLFQNIIGHALVNDITIWSTQIGSNLNSGFSTGSANVIATARSVASGIQSGVAGLYNAMYSAGSNAGAGLYYGLGSWGWSLSSLAWSMANNINSAARAALQIKSPSSVLRETMGFAGEGMYLGLADWEDQIVGEADTIAEGVNDAISQEIGIGELQDVTADNFITANANQQQQILDLLTRYLPQLANMQVMIDGDKEVGVLMPRIDRELSRMQTMADRGVYA